MTTAVYPLASSFAQVAPWTERRAVRDLGFYGGGGKNPLGFGLNGKAAGIVLAEILGESGPHCVGATFDDPPAGMTWGGRGGTIL